jgi:nitrate reductase beta subunit
MNETVKQSMGIEKTGFSRDELWKMADSRLPEHETFLFYLQWICNHCNYSQLLGRMSEEGD